MGQAVTKAAGASKDAEVVAGVDVIPGPEASYPLYGSLSSCETEADVLVDFSSPKALDDILSYIREKKMPAVLCTTGYTPEQIKAIEEASKEVPILRSANMSLGVNVLAKVLTEISNTLIFAGFDAEIVEKHHRLKKDAPSGTALLLADAVNKSVDDSLSYVYDRSGRSLQRPDNEIGISAVRGGTIPGDHDVIFAGEDEVITFSHRAYSKAVFAKGAVQAAIFMKGRAPGMYDMQDVIGGD